MVTRKRWADLRPRSRKVLVVAGACEAAMKLAALVDLVRRPASQIRGSKAGWAAAIVVINSVGLVPLSYFAFGRRAD